jgi:hypothetical protein
VRPIGRETSYMLTNRSAPHVRRAATSVASGHVWQTLSVIRLPPLMKGHASAKRQAPSVV